MTAGVRMKFHHIMGLRAPSGNSCSEAIPSAKRARPQREWTSSHDLDNRVNLSLQNPRSFRLSLSRRSQTRLISMPQNLTALVPDDNTFGDGSEHWHVEGEEPSLGSPSKHCNLLRLSTCHNRRRRRCRSTRSQAVSLTLPVREESEQVL